MTRMQLSCGPSGRLLGWLCLLGGLLAAGAAPAQTRQEAIAARNRMVDREIVAAASADRAAQPPAAAGGRR